MDECTFGEAKEDSNVLTVLTGCDRGAGAGQEKGKRLKGWTACIIFHLPPLFLYGCSV